MLSRLIRLVFSLTAVAPLSVSLAYAFAREHNYGWALAAAGACILLAFLARWIITTAGRKLAPLAITVSKAKSADKEVIAFFVAYALPLVLKGQAAPDLTSWMVAAVMLLTVIWGTHSLQINPVLGIMGFHFYEVDTQGGLTYLMITRGKITNVSSIKTVVQLSDYGLLQIK
ncbi:hypothetical protein [Robbsia sp. KACC 23696]|uniref:hypothetical protein n=1 Tax=Robbsia sp. KACC 23696 TaxID=3149231 RepID=UPI00325A6BED